MFQAKRSVIFVGYHHNVVGVKHGEQAPPGRLNHAFACAQHINELLGVLPG
jgi:hypothetical protein